MASSFTSVQKQRLRNLGVAREIVGQEFQGEQERDTEFRRIEKEASREGRDRLMNLRETRLRPVLCDLEDRLVGALTQIGFVQVVTPLIISGQMLEKMSVTLDHPLSKQVFWLEKNRCLRPMLAPGLYTLSRRLMRLWERPIRIFEVGPCFRRESRGG